MRRGGLAAAQLAGRAEPKGSGGVGGASPRLGGASQWCGAAARRGGWLGGSAQRLSGAAQRHSSVARDAQYGRWRSEGRGAGRTQKQVAFLRRRAAPVASRGGGGHVMVRRGRHSGAAATSAHQGPCPRGCEALQGSGCGHARAVCVYCHFPRPGLVFGKSLRFVAGWP